MLKRRDPKRWLAIGIIVFLTSVFSLAKPTESGKKGCAEVDARGKKCRQIPDGGSAAAYLLMAGSTCLGAMFIGSRLRNPCL
jgi:hypothetical protein